MTFLLAFYIIICILTALFPAVAVLLFMLDKEEAASIALVFSILLGLTYFVTTVYILIDKILT